MFRASCTRTGDAGGAEDHSGIMGMPVPLRWDGTNTSRSSGWGVDAQRIQDALATTLNIGVENTVPQGGVVWVFAVQEVIGG